MWEFASSGFSRTIQRRFKGSKGKASASSSAFLWKYPPGPRPRSISKPKKRSWATSCPKSDRSREEAGKELALERLCHEFPRNFFDHRRCMLLGERDAEVRETPACFRVIR